MSSSYELLKTIVIILGVFALLYFFKQNTETMVDFDKLSSYDNAPQEYALVPPVNTFQEGEPVTTLEETEGEGEDPLEKVIVGEDTLQAEELLPKYDDANEFAKQNPVTELLKEQNYLVSGHHLGINTTMQSSKIPYLDIRSLPPVPKSDWPINNSSLDRSNAFQRRPLEIGV